MRKRPTVELEQARMNHPDLGSPEWSMTACSMLVTCEPDDIDGVPKRVCRKCRERLRDCTLIGDES